jgi:DNA-binding transcriptional LysR family regulator
MDRLSAMRAFAAVADLGSFAEAGRRMRLSAAGVTRAVAQLEDELGLTLLHRTTRALRLTERGAVYLDACRRILADVEEAERLARGADAAPRGALSVAAPLMFGRLHVLPIVAALLHTHELLSVRLLLSDRVAHFAEEGIDVAVRIGELADSALLAIKVAEVRRVLVASPAYLAARGTPAAPADLAGHDLISFEGGDPASEWSFADGHTRLRVAPRLAVNSADAAIAAAEAGLGVTRTLSYQAREAVAEGRLLLLLDRFGPAAMPVSVVHPARRQGSANIAAFMAAARNHFRDFADLPRQG